jgi:NAD-dependent SIR2 family protein deacetylase
MHGELLKARCVACGKVTVWYDDLTGSEDCPICAIEGQLRPHVVWFGEMPLGLDTVYQVLTPCKVFLSIGTSRSALPAVSSRQRALSKRHAAPAPTQSNSISNPERQPLRREDLRTGHSNCTRICGEIAGRAVSSGAYIQGIQAAATWSGAVRVAWCSAGNDRVISVPSPGWL